MKPTEKLTELPQVSFQSVYAIMEHAEKFHLLVTAINHGVFEHLTTPKTSEALANELKTDLRLTTKLCNALTAMGLLTKSDLCYCNTSLSNTYLVNDSPFYQLHLLNLKYNGIQRRLKLLPEALKQGSLKVEQNSAGVFDSDFILAMAEGALRSGLQKTVNIVNEMDEFKTAKTLLDMGGGHGLYAIAFAQANPELEAYVLDFPHVIDSVTKTMISDFGLTDRVHTIPADFTKDDLKGPYDVIFASDTLYKATSQLSAMFQKVASSLNDGGLFVSKHWFLNDDKVSPLTAVLFDLTLSIQQHGAVQFNLFTLKEFLETLNSTGFQLKNVSDISVTNDPSRLVIAKRCL